MLKPEIIRVWPYWSEIIESDSFDLLSSYDFCGVWSYFYEEFDTVFFFEGFSAGNSILLLFIFIISENICDTLIISFLRNIVIIFSNKLYWWLITFVEKNITQGDKS